jgi:hypothetical protein
MTDESARWARLSGGPCDGETVFAERGCWAVIVTRDSDRRPWNRHMITSADLPVFLVANEAHVYMQDVEGAFVNTPSMLRRFLQWGQPVWELNLDE